MGGVESLPRERIPAATLDRVFANLQALAPQQPCFEGAQVAREGHSADEAANIVAGVGAAGTGADVKPAGVVRLAANRLRGSGQLGVDRLPDGLFRRTVSIVVYECLTAF